MTQLQQQGGGNAFNASDHLNGVHEGASGASVSPLNTLKGHEQLVKNEVADSPSEAGFSVKSEASAVEEAAVAALGQLSKAKPNEGGDESRICEL